MGFHISRVQITNFRNFKELNVHLYQKAVVVGENASGKSNFVHALRLVLDPNLPDSARQLDKDDFWDGLIAPEANGESITIVVELQGFEDNDSLLAILSDYQIPGEMVPTARITYKFAPKPVLGEGDPGEMAQYTFIVYGGEDEAQTFGYQQRKWIPLQVLPALRDAETDLNSWRKSPLRPLLDRLNVKREELESATTKINDATSEITNLAEVKLLTDEIKERVEQMVGKFQSILPTFGVAPTDALRLLRSLKLFVDGERQRPIGGASLGICNVLYLSLLMLELEHKEANGERASTILVIEEPEAHLHPHLQRLVYHDFLRRKSSVLLTTHSPNIVSVSPVRSLVLISNKGDDRGSIATSTAKATFTDIEIQDLERYIDTTRGELLFAKGAVLVEGVAELYTIPALAEALNKQLDERGISVCSVHGTDFVPYARVLGKDALDVPFVIITDGDREIKDGNTLYHGYRRGVRIANIEKPEMEEEFSELIDNRDWDEINSRLKDLGIFVGNTTLEIDLCDKGYGEEFLDAIKDLGAGPRRQNKFKSALELRDNDAYILKTIESYGKGRFSQRLAPKMDGARIPDYIENAIQHIVRLVTG